MNGKTYRSRTRFEHTTSKWRGECSNHFTSNPADVDEKILQFKVNYKPKAQIEAKLREKFESYFRGNLWLAGS